MFKKKTTMVAVVAMITLLTVIAGCGGGGGKRVTGLSPDGVVKTFVNAAKAGKLNEAGLYVSPTSASDPKAIAEFISGDDLKELKKSNVAAVKVVAQSGDYAAVVVTLQQENTFNVTVKPVGLERIKGEWYIVAFDQIYQNAKYGVLAQLLRSI